MVFRDGGAGTWGWVRVDRTGQPAWALPAETIIAVLPIVMLVANFLRGTIGPTPAGYATLALAAAVLMVLPAFAILRQSILGLALMFAPIAAGWLLPGELGHAAGTYVGITWAAIAAVNLVHLRR